MTTGAHENLAVAEGAASQTLDDIVDDGIDEVRSHHGAHAHLGKKGHALAVVGHRAAPVLPAVAQALGHEDSVVGILRKKRDERFELHAVDDEFNLFHARSSPLNAPKGNSL